MRNVELTTSLPSKRFLAAMAVCLGLIVLGGCFDELDSSAAGSSEADLILGGEPPMSPEAQARADWERADLNRADIAVTGSVSETSDTGATVTGIPSGVISAGQSVVMSEVTYSYDSPVDMLMPNAVTFSRKFYLRPRKSDKVAKTS